MKWFAQKISWSRVAGLGLLILLLAVRIADPNFVQQLRHLAFDTFQQIHPRDPGSYPVAILDVDDQSLQEVGQWPWPRTQIAQMTQKAMQAGAVAIAFDIIFSEPDRLSPEKIARDNADLPENVRGALMALPSNDEVLSQTFAQSRVVVGQTSVRSAASNTDDKAEMRPVPYAFLGPDPTGFMQQFPDIVQNLPEIEDAAAGRGVFTVRPDPDGIYRRVPVVMTVQDEIRLGLSIELLRVATGGDAFAIRSNEAGIDGVVVARQLIETAQDGTIWNYFSPSSQARYVSAADLLNDRVPPGRLAGHLVLVGTSAIGLEDFRATPLGVAMAGVEIHAQVLENILGQTLLTRPNYAIGLELVWITVLSLLIIALAPMMAARWLILATVTIVVGYAGFAYFLFVDRLQLLDPTYPIIATVLTVMLMSTANYVREEVRRQQIRSAFGQYVSPDLVAQLSDNPDKLTLGGERRDLTILFSDVRGFTTISEEFKDDPAGLTTLMNRFLTVLSNAIMSENGTIDKFMGDAVMAFWNAPLDEPEHARRGCAAALKMLADVEALNQARLAEGEAGHEVHRIDVGIGLNTGSCVVGNMGSDTRFDYSALGDSVNLASRLEGQTKTYGVSIILGESTALAISESFAVIELDLIRVKGKTLPERIFGLLGGEEMASRPEFRMLKAANDTALAAYRAQDWPTARDGLAELQRASEPLGLEMSDYVQMHLARIELLDLEPPEADWDGVYEAQSK